MSNMQRSGDDEDPLAMSVRGNGRTNVLIDGREHSRYTVTNVP